MRLKLFVIGIWILVSLIGVVYFIPTGDQTLGSNQTSIVVDSGLIISAASLLVSIVSAAFNIYFSLRADQRASAGKE